MKKRTISAFLALCIFIPILYYGGIPYTIMMYILSLQGMREVFDALGKKKNVPQFVQCISYLIITYLVLTAGTISSITAIFDFRLLSCIVLLYLIPVIIYQKDSTYGIVDAFFMIGIVSLLGLCFSLFVVIRNIEASWIVYLLLITIFTDTYAYLTGSLIGKHKCIPKISPNKSWEGYIGGTLMGVFVGSTYLITVHELSFSLFGTICMTLFLSVIGQFGDLIFSAMKRNFNIKDFSDFMPGHGGILDRFDSIFFVLMAFTFFIHIL
jgi:phosphatidate cytidylyltransferase